MIVFAFVICFPAVRSQPAPNGQVQISCTLSDTRVTLDDTFALKVDIVWDADGADYIYTWPAPPASDKLEVVGTGSASRRTVENGRTMARKTFSYTLKPLTTGTAAIEPFTVTYKDPATGREGRERTGYLQVTVNRPEPRSNAVRNVVAGLLAAAFIFVAGFMFVTGKKRRQEAVATPEKAVETPIPEDRAREKLEGLDRLKMAGETKEYCLAVTRTLKSYLAEKFGVDGGNLLTPEMVAALMERQVDDSIVSRVQSVLELADQLKFASGEPPVGQLERLQVLMNGLLQDAGVPQQETNG